MVAVNLEQHLRNLQEQSGLQSAEFREVLDRRFELLRFFTAEYERLRRQGEVVTVIGSYLGSALSPRGSVIGHTVPHFAGYAFASSKYLPVDADIAMPEWRRGRLRNSRKREVPLPDDSTLARWELQSCSSCHARPECLSCHRPDAADPAPGYHPVGFLTSHPAAAYTRESSCSDCHNQGQFCANCHLNAGLVSPGPATGRPVS